MEDHETIMVSLSCLDDKLERVLTVLESFMQDLERFRPLLDKYENGGPLGVLFGNRKEATWPTK